jgi:hypothetical protein
MNGVIKRILAFFCDMPDAPAGQPAVKLSDLQQEDAHDTLLK